MVFFNKLVPKACLGPHQTPMMERLEKKLHHRCLVGCLWLLIVSTNE